MKNRGFTLIELLVVLVILSLTVTLVGGVTFRQVERAKQTQEFEALQQIIAELALQAVVKRKAVTLVLDGYQLKAHTQNQLVVQKNFEHLYFNQQRLELNANGFWSRETISIAAGSRNDHLPLNPGVFYYGN